MHTKEMSPIMVSVSLQRSSHIQKENHGCDGTFQVDNEDCTLSSDLSTMDFPRF